MSEPYRHQHLDSNNSLRQTCEEYAREQWGPIVANANREITVYRNENLELMRKNRDLSADAEAGRAFKKLMKELNENPAAKHYWDKFMMVLKLQTD